MMPVATALSQSGAGKMIANAVISMGSDLALTLQQLGIIRIVLCYDSIYV